MMFLFNGVIFSSHVSGVYQVQFGDGWKCELMWICLRSYFYSSFSSLPGKAERVAY